ncbi:hypothetical protein GQ457_03G023040 [Hibiscus cannabinus]
MGPNRGCIPAASNDRSVAVHRWIAPILRYLARAVEYYVLTVGIRRRWLRPQLECARGAPFLALLGPWVHHARFSLRPWVLSFGARGATVEFGIRLGLGFVMVFCQEEKNVLTLSTDEGQDDTGPAILKRSGKINALTLSTDEGQDDTGPAILKRCGDYPALLR